MADFRDVYEFNLEGNFKEQLEALEGGLYQVRKDWRDLKREFAKDAEFRKPASAFKQLKGEAREAAIAANKLKVAETQLLKPAQAQARAYNKLANEQNRLTIARQADLIALEQARRGTDPRIVQIRGEARALRALTRELEDRAFKQQFATLAAERGLKVSADGKRFFDAEAQAMRRAAKAAEELAIAKALADKGLNKDGTIKAPEVPKDIQLQQRAEKKLQADIDKFDYEKRLATLRKESPEWARMREEMKKARGELALLDGTGKKVEGTFNRISFTFRRLIGIMAAFTVARVVTREFIRMIGTAVAFNSEMERARVGISGLIAAAADVRAPDGRAIGIDEKLIATQDLAIRQMRLLRRDALETAASFQDLAAAFQTAIAPGLNNNLTLDQIRELTVDISQAASGLGVAQNQLAEEIRSLFEGTITPRNTRVATALGISNADIRRAKELGNLFGYLQSRFSAISANGIRLMETFEAQMSNAADAFKQLLEQSSKPLFLQLKQGLEDVQKAIFTFTDADVVFDKQALKGFEALFNGLAKGVEGIRAAFKGIDAQGFADALGAIGESLGLLGTLLAGSIRTVFNAITPVISAFNALAGILNSVLTYLAANSNNTFGYILKTVTRSVVAVVALEKAYKSIRATLVGIKSLSLLIFQYNKATAAQQTLMAANLSSIKKLVLSVTALFKRLLLPILAVTAAILLIDGVLDVFGVKFSVFDALAEGFGYLNDQVDRLLVGAEKATEAATELTEPERVAQIISKYSELRAEIDDLAVSLDRKAKVATRNLYGELNKLRADDDALNIFRTQVNALDEYEQQIRGLDSALKDLEDKRSSTFASVSDSMRKPTEDMLSATLRLNQSIARLNEAQTAVDNIDPQLARADAVSRAVLREAYKPPEQIRKVLLDLENATIQYESELKAVGAAQQDIATAAQLISDATGRANSLSEEAINIQKVKNGLLEKARALADIDIRKQAEVLKINQQTAKLTAEYSILAAQADTAAAREANQGRADLLRSELAIIQQENSALQDRQKLSESILTIQETIENLVSSGTENFDLIDSLQKTRTGYEEIRDLIGAANAERLKALEAEKKLAALRADTGSFGAGATLALRDFKAQNNLNQAGQNFTGGALNGLASAVNQTVAAAFDPTSNFDLATTVRSLGVSLIAGLAEDAVKSLFSSLIPELANTGKDAAAKAADATADATRISAMQSASAAAVTSVSTSFTTAGTALSEVLGAAALGFTQAVTAASQAAIQAILAAQAAVSGQQTGGAVVGALAGAAAGTAGAAHGGRVSDLQRFRGNPALTHRRARGFAGGGRPAGLDPRDTIPAWLRPGEFVIRPEAVSRYGDWLFDLLNRGALNPNALSGLRAGAPKVRSSRTSKAGYATGGGVAASAGSRGAAGRSIQFFDEQTMDRAYAAGGGSLDRFVRQRRSNFRAALGLEAGT